KSSNEGLNSTTSDNVRLSAAVLNSSIHACDISNIASVTRQEKGLGLFLAQILSSSFRGGRDVTDSLVKPQTKVSMPYASLIAPKLSKQIIKCNYVCVRVNEQVLQGQFNVGKFFIISFRLWLL
ncbi:hypothetical protein PanWU01x14_021240, partial [Parasponia andersonii]